MVKYLSGHPCFRSHFVTPHEMVVGSSWLHRGLCGSNEEFLTNFGYAATFSISFTVSTGAWQYNVSGRYLTAGSSYVGCFGFLLMAMPKVIALLLCLFYSAPVFLYLCSQAHMIRTRRGATNRGPQFHVMHFLGSDGLISIVLPMLK